MREAGRPTETETPQPQTALGGALRYKPWLWLLSLGLALAAALLFGTVRRIADGVLGGGMVATASGVAAAALLVAGAGTPVSGASGIGLLLLALAVGFIERTFDKRSPRGRSRAGLLLSLVAGLMVAVAPPAVRLQVVPLAGNEVGQRPCGALDAIHTCALLVQHRRLRANTTQCFFGLHKLALEMLNQPSRRRQRDSHRVTIPERATG